MKRRITAAILAMILCFSFVVSASSATVEQENALRTAQKYLSFLAFSKNGLIEQLEFEGFSSEEASYGVEYCGADWYEQAEKKAKSYLRSLSFSKTRLEEQLIFDGFTNEEALFGVENCNADWFEQAEKKAKSYLGIFSFSKTGLEEQLIHDGFTKEEAFFGVDHCNADWYEQAVKSGESYLRYWSFTRNELYEQLLYEDFTENEAEYTVNQIFNKPNPTVAPTQIPTASPAPVTTPTPKPTATPVPPPTSTPTPAIKPEYKFDSASYNGKAVTGTITHVEGTDVANKLQARVTFFITGNYYMATVGEIDEDGNFEVEGVGPIEYISVLAYEESQNGGRNIYGTAEIYVK